MVVQAKGSAAETAEAERRALRYEDIMAALSVEHEWRFGLVGTMIGSTAVFSDIPQYAIAFAILGIDDTV